MANLRVSVLIRTDLNLPVGLLAAQVAHLASLPAHTFLQNIVENDTIEKINLKAPDFYLIDWIKDPYLFIHKVPNKEVLDYFMDEATKLKVPASSWYDTIYIDMSSTQKKAFSGVLVGCVFGPCDSDKIKQVIGDLPLL